jgi:hypothetical protein
VTVYVVTVCTVGAEGLTVCAAVTALLLQLYVFAPLADNDELNPVHITPGVAVDATVGKGLIVKGTAVEGP